MTSVFVEYIDVSEGLVKLKVVPNQLAGMPVYPEKGSIESAFKYGYCHQSCELLGDARPELGITINGYNAATVACALLAGLTEEKKSTARCARSSRLR